MSKQSLGTLLVMAVAAAAFVMDPALAEDRKVEAEPEARISADGRAVEVKRAADKESIRVPVLDRCGNPVPGPPKILHLKFYEGDLLAHYGKHCWARISMKTLEVECSGCD